MWSFNDLKKNLKKDIGKLPKLKVALLGDTATQFLASAIKGIGVEYGFDINLFEAEYNQIEQQFMDPTSDLHQLDAQYIVVYQSSHKWNEKYSLLSVEEQSHLADERLDFVTYICQSTSSKIIYLNYSEIEDGVWGSFDNRIEHSFIYQTRKMNYSLMLLSQKLQNLFICDISAIQNKYGRDFIFDSTVYTSTEMILSIDSLPIVAKRIMDIIASMQGKIKKCLILDLDNTLWGGVIGDDGIEGIQLGHSLGIGKAFTEFQMWVKKLKDRGIIICICSKNDEDKAKEPFIKHPDMILHLEDISVFMANWETKVDNIRTIQKVLNIGFDSMIFLDDNPFERNIVRENIPDITVPELPSDPAEYLEFVYGENLFETISYSTLDKNRTEQYQTQAKRMAFEKTFSSESDFLQSLDMVSVVEGFTSFNTPRVAQLSQRSNQFNLRTIRYTETDIEAMSKDDKIIPLTFTLQDKFGDNGLICVIIMKAKDMNTLFVDTWFMSCRVLKRGMENFTLNTMVEIAKQRGYKQIIGEYIPSPKNKMVENHYLTLGFSKVKNEDKSLFLLDLDTYQKKECHIKRK